MFDMFVPRLTQLPIRRTPQPSHTIRNVTLLPDSSAILLYCTPVGAPHNSAYSNILSLEMSGRGRIPCDFFETCKKTFQLDGFYRNHMFKKHNTMPRYSTQRIISPDPLTKPIIVDSEEEGEEDEEDSEGDDYGEDDYGEDEEDSENLERGLPIVRRAPNSFVPAWGNRHQSEAVKNLRIVEHPSAGEVCGVTEDYDEKGAAILEDPWSPFSSALEFLQVKHFVDFNMPDKGIIQFFNQGLCREPEKFTVTSAETMKKCLESIDPDYPQFVEHGIPTRHGKRTFYCRNVLECVKYLFSKRYHKSYTDYAPQKRFFNNDDDSDDSEKPDRNYTEMNTGDWWWDLQDEIVRGYKGKPPVKGATIVPIICSSDETHLSNHSGDVKAWPIYLTLGNFHISPRSKASNRAYMVLAVLPPKPKLRKISKALDNEYREIAKECMQYAFREAFKSLKDLPDDGVVMDCPDGKKRRCFPVLAVWSADHMENCELHAAKSNSCPKCLVPSKELGTMMSEGVYPMRNPEEHNRKFAEYKAVRDDPARKDTRKELEAWFTANNARLQPNVLTGFPYSNAVDVHVPDMLHTVYLGLLKHVSGWVDDFLAFHNRQGIFDDVFAGIGPHRDFRHMNKPFRAISQWTGLDYRNLGKIIVPALAAALENCSVREKPLFHRAIACARAVVDFTTMINYRFIYDSDFAFIEKAFEELHETKDIFLQFRTKKRGKQLATAAKKRFFEEAVADFEKETRLMSYTPAQKKARTAIMVAEANKVYDSIIAKHQDFDFPKIHLLSHFLPAIRRFGCAAGMTSESGERFHQDEFKNTWKFSNKNRNAQFHMNLDRERSNKMSSRFLELKACMRDLPADRRNVIQNTLNLFSAKDQVEVNRLRRRNLPIPPDTYPFRDEVYEDYDGVTESVLMYPVGDNGYAGLYRIGRNGKLHHLLRRYLSNLKEEVVLSENESKRLCVREYCVLQIIRAAFHPYEGCTPEREILRCYGDKPFRKKIRNDDVFIEYEVSGESDRLDMDNLYAGKLVKLLQVWVETTDNQQPPPNQIFRVAVIERYQTLNSGHGEEQSGLCRLEMEPENYEVVDVGDIWGGAHLIEIPDVNRSSKFRQFFVNNTADLRTYNTIYNRDFVVGDRPDGLDEEIEIDDLDASLEFDRVQSRNIYMDHSDDEGDGEFDDQGLVNYE